MGGVIGLDMHLIRGLAEDLGIEKDSIFYSKLKTFSGECMRIWADGESKSETDEEYLESMERAAKRMNGQPK